MNDLAEKYLNGKKFLLKKLKLLCVKVLLIQKVTPAFCGSAFKNKGVQLCLMPLLIIFHLH